jgi:hypothetical protein
MAGNTFEERLARLEEEMKALQALTRGIAAWETGVTTTPDPETKNSATARSAAHDGAVGAGEPAEPRAL